MLREALAFPRKRDGATRDLLLGGALLIASPLLIPVVLVWGYLLRVMDAAARGRDGPPPLVDFGRMLVEGLRAAVVAVAWGLLPLVALVVGTAAWAWWVVLGGTFRVPSFGLAQVTPTQAGIVAAVAVPLLLVAVVCWLHLPAALAAVGTQSRLRAGFQTGALWAIVNTRQYVAGVLLAALVGAVGALLSAALLPVLLVGFVVAFYVQVVVAYVVGRSVGGAAVTAIRPA